MVKLYGHESCSQCKYAKTYLEGRGVQFEYVDVRIDAEAMAYLKKAGVYSLPVIERVSDNKMVIGLNINEICKLLEV